MKIDQDWRGTGLVLLIINWMASFSLAGRIGEALWGTWYSKLSLLGLIPAVLLTIAWKRRPKNPVPVKSAVLGLGLAAFAGYTMTQAVPKIYFSMFGTSLWPWVVPPLIYLGLAATVLIMTFRWPEEPEPAPGNDQIQRRWLKYLIWINFLSLAIMSAWWVFVGVLVIAAATLGAWRFTPGRAALTWGLAVTQVAALASWYFGREIAGSEVALWFQIAISIIGLLLAVLTIPLVRALKDGAVSSHMTGLPEAAQAPPKSLGRRWGLAIAAGIIIGFSAISWTCNYFLPDEMRSTPHVGPMKSVRMGWLELRVPQDAPAPRISVNVIWPEGEVMMTDVIYDQSRTGPEQMADQIDKALDTELRERIQALFETGVDDIFKKLPLARNESTRESRPERSETRTAVMVDEHFQRPARLVAGGAISEIELFIEMPEGFLKFEYNPRSYRSGKDRPTLSEEEGEAWLIERARELLDIYTWTGSPGGENGGFITNYGVLKPEPGAGFNLHISSSFIGKNQDFHLLTLHSRSWPNPLFTDIGLETKKKWLLTYALRQVMKGEFIRVRLRHLNLAGLSGMEEAQLSQSSDKTSLMVRWDTSSGPTSWFDGLEMFCNNLEDDEDVAARLGLWEAVAFSVRRLDALPTTAESAAQNQ